MKNGKRIKHDSDADIFEDVTILAVIGEFAVKFTLLASGSYPKMYPSRPLHRLPSQS